MGDFDLNILDIIDIALFAALLFYLYRLVRGTAAIYIFGGIVALYVVWKLVDALQMDLLTEVLGQFIGVGFIALIIVFQQEIRKFLLVIGSSSFGRHRKFFRYFLKVRQEEKEVQIDTIVQAAYQMSETKTGVLIAIERKLPLGYFAQTGIAINGDMSVGLLHAIFFKDAPLHDGAVIIVRDKIVAASAILPVSENPNVPNRYGMRHRAALGLTEKSDALCVVVSEETGQVSLVVEGEIHIIREQEEMRRRLTEMLRY